MTCTPIPGYIVVNDTLKPYIYVDYDGRRKFCLDNNYHSSAIYKVREDGVKTVVLTRVESLETFSPNNRISVVVRCFEEEGYLLMLIRKNIDFVKDFNLASRMRTLRTIDEHVKLSFIPTHGLYINSVIVSRNEPLIIDVALNRNGNSGILTVRIPLVDENNKRFLLYFMVDSIKPELAKKIIRSRIVELSDFYYIYKDGDRYEAKKLVPRLDREKLLQELRELTISQRCIMLRSCDISSDRYLELVENYGDDLIVYDIRVTNKVIEEQERKECTCNEDDKCFHKCYSDCFFKCIEEQRNMLNREQWYIDECRIYCNANCECDCYLGCEEEDDYDP